MLKSSIYTNKLIFCGLITLSVLVLLPDAFSAVQGTENMADQFEKVEKVMTGGYLRLGLMGICGVSAAMSIVKQNVMGLVISGLGLLFVFLMKGWITTTFTALI